MISLQSLALGSDVFVSTGPRVELKTTRQMIEGEIPCQHQRDMAAALRRAGWTTRVTTLESGVLNIDSVAVGIQPLSRSLFVCSVVHVYTRKALSAMVAESMQTLLA